MMGFETIRYDVPSGELVILDQTCLPSETKYLRLKTKHEVYDAIKRLCVRGAPAIGVAAGYGLYLCVKDIEQDFFTQFNEIKDYLGSSRPTAVNLFWALNKMQDVVTKNKDMPLPEIKQKLLAQADDIMQEDVDTCQKIGEYGLSVLKEGMGILTHCNAGALATSGVGTALAPIYLGQEKGYNFKVFADETRPLLQGARLTAYELDKCGVDVTLICDNMASIVMRNGWVDAVIVGCDRVAKNGDFANKIGTSGVAILAKNYGIPFYVAAPTSTIDVNTPTGNEIEIELRQGDEISHMWYQTPMTGEGVKTYNPAFDVTDAKFVTAFITEKGILKPPFTGFS